MKKARSTQLKSRTKARTRPARGPIAWRWHERKLKPIHFVQAVALDDLIDIDRQKAALLQNTLQFVQGKPANHVLLTGARGTGKSSIVKAMLNHFAPQGLRLVEVAVHDLVDLPEIVAPLRSKAERFILYVDDFSVAASDPALVALKTALDGGIEEPPDNVLIYATSNRRHLMPRGHDEARGLVAAQEDAEEQVSVSDRFGLWLGFPPMDQPAYLDAIDHYAERFDLRTDDLHARALQWSQMRGSRSGRVAWQFIRDLAGELGKTLPL